MAGVPAWAGVGSTSRAALLSTALTPTCPTVNQFDLLLAIITTASNDGENYTLSGVTGWTLRKAVNSGGGAPQGYIYTKRATGAESGQVVTCAANSGTTGTHRATVHRFTNVRDVSFYEPGIDLFSTGTVVNDAGVQTFGDGRLACNVVMDNGSDAAFGNFVGASTPWVERHWTNAGGAPSHGIQTANMPVPSIIDGGSKTLGAARNVRVFGFALVAPTPVGMNAIGMQELSAQEIGVPWLVVIEIDHKDLSEPVRITSDTVPTTSMGHVYSVYPFKIVPPDQVEGRSPRAQLQLDNVTKEVIGLLRGLTSPPALNIRVVRSADPDVAMKQYLGMEWTSTAYDSGASIIGTIEAKDTYREEFPFITFDGRFVGLLP